MVGTEVWIQGIQLLKLWYYACHLLSLSKADEEVLKLFKKDIKKWHVSPEPWWEEDLIAPSLFSNLIYKNIYISLYYAYPFLNDVY